MKNPISLPLHGRGAVDNPPPRFDPLRYERDPDAEPGEESAPRTQFLRDTSRTIIAYNDSPDVGFHPSVKWTPLSRPIKCFPFRIVSVVA